MFEFLLYGIPPLALSLIFLSLLIFLANPKSYFLIVFAIGLFGIVYYYMNYLTLFTQICISPLINYLRYGGTVNIYLYGSIMVVAGLCLISVVSLWNILDSWNRDKVTIWR